MPETPTGTTEKSLLPMQSSAHPGKFRGRSPVPFHLNQPVMTDSLFKSPNMVRLRQFIVIIYFLSTISEAQQVLIIDPINLSTQL